MYGQYTRINPLFGFGLIVLENTKEVQTSTQIRVSANFRSATRNKWSSNSRLCAAHKKTSSQCRARSSRETCHYHRLARLGYSRTERSWERAAEAVELECTRAGNSMASDCSQEKGCGNHSNRTSNWLFVNISGCRSEGWRGDKNCARFRQVFLRFKFSLHCWTSSSRYLMWDVRYRMVRWP